MINLYQNIFFCHIINCQGHVSTMITSKLLSKDNKHLKIHTYHKANNPFKAINIKYQLNELTTELYMFKITNKIAEVTYRLDVFIVNSEHFQEKVCINLLFLWIILG